MDPTIIGSGLLSLGGGILNNLLAGSRQSDAQNFAAQQVQQQEAFQERMRSTAYQTAVTDMKAAGLNPMLAAGINTSVPTGSAATGISAAPTSDPVTPALNSAMQTAKVKNELDVANLQKQNLVQDNYIKQNQVGEIAARTANLIKEGPGIEARSETLKQLVETAVNNAISARNERPYLSSAIAPALSSTARGMQDIYRILPQLQGFSFRGSSARQSGWVGGNEVDTLTQNRSWGN